MHSRLMDRVSDYTVGPRDAHASPAFIRSNRWKADTASLEGRAGIVRDGGAKPEKRYGLDTQLQRGHWGGPVAAGCEILRKSEGNAASYGDLDPFEMTLRFDGWPDSRCQQ